MKLFHRRWQEDVSLLAAGALAETARPTVLRHVETCAACRLELAQARGVLGLLAREHEATAPPISLTALRVRVEARLHEDQEEVPAAAPTRGVRPAWSTGWAAWSRPAAAAVAIVIVAGLVLLLPRNPRPVEEIVISQEAVQRLERNVAREQTVHYLREAHDVLVNVAATLPRCTRRTRALEVTEEAQRSRDLLARRALLVDVGERHVASAAPVLDDVEHLLHAVASLEDCARGGDLQLIQHQIAERRVLMKISLMERELLG